MASLQRQQSVGAASIAPRIVAKKKTSKKTSAASSSSSSSSPGPTTQPAATLSSVPSPLLLPLPPSSYDSPPSSSHSRLAASDSTASSDEPRVVEVFPYPTVSFPSPILSATQPAAVTSDALVPLTAINALTGDASAAASFSSSSPSSASARATPSGTSDRASAAPSAAVDVDSPIVAAESPIRLLSPAEEAANNRMHDNFAEKLFVDPKVVLQMYTQTQLFAIADASYEKSQKATSFIVQAFAMIAGTVLKHIAAVEAGTSLARHVDQRHETSAAPVVSPSSSSSITPSSVYVSPQPPTFAISKSGSRSDRASAAVTMNWKEMVKHLNNKETMSIVAATCKR